MEDLISPEILEKIIACIESILKFDTFEKTARFIFDKACEITDAKSGYVALLNKDNYTNELLFLESGGINCTVDPTLPMLMRGLRAEAYKKKNVVFNNDFMNSVHRDLMPDGHMALKNVLFAPLILEEESVGVIGIANKKGGFTERDAYYCSILGKIASVALYNSRNIGKLNLILSNLQKSMDEIKTLKSLLPICSYCKKIRNDEDGYWEQLESYISEHSETKFTHGVCPDCSKKILGGLDDSDKNS
jgi:hypothetical protein